MYQGRADASRKETEGNRQRKKLAEARCDALPLAATPAVPPQPVAAAVAEDSASSRDVVPASSTLAGCNVGSFVPHAYHMRSPKQPGCQPYPVILLECIRWILGSGPENRI